MWLDYLTSMNAVAIMMRNNQDNTATEFDSLAKSKFDTIIALPDPQDHHLYAASLGLNEREIYTVSTMKSLYRHFMIKKEDHTYIAELNLNGIDTVLSILEGNDQLIKLVELLIKQTADNPNKWLPVFYDEINKLKEANSQRKL